MYVNIHMSYVTYSAFIFVTLLEFKTFNLFLSFFLCFFLFSDVSQWNVVKKVSLLACPRSWLFWRRMIIGYSFIGETFRSYHQALSSPSSLAYAICLSLSPHALTVETMSCFTCLKLDSIMDTAKIYLRCLRVYIPYVIKCLSKRKVF